MQSEILLLSNVKEGNIASVVQKEFELLGVTNIKGKRIDADKESIYKNFTEALSDYNIIMIIGGMSEDEGNMTVDTVTSAIGYNKINKNGEVFPEGAEIFFNKSGKPSGCAISQGNQCIIMLPGDNETFSFMLVYRIAKYLCNFMGVPYCLKTLRACDITKSEAEAAVNSADTDGAKVLVFEDGDEIAIQVCSKAKSSSEAKELCISAVKNIASKTGSAVYAVDAENIGQAFGKELTKKGLRAAIAIDGFEKAEIMNCAYVSEYVEHYSGMSTGIERFEIPEKLLERYGRNSEWTSAVLAGEVFKTEGGNIGISLTSDPKKPESGAYVAVAMGDNVWTKKVEAQNREELVSLAGAKAVHLARAVVSAYPKAYENSVSLMSAVSGKTKFNTDVSSTAKKKWYSRFIIMKGDKKSDIIRKSIFWICVVVFIASMSYLGSKAANAVNQRGLNANLKELVGSENFIPPRDWEYLDKFYGLYKENSDFIGYISIADTNVDYPVVQTTVANEKGLTGQYYLRKDYYGAYSMYGTPFLDYRCSYDPDFPSKNLVIYGHNIYDDGQMFSDLVKYRKLSFYRKHPIIQFDTLYEEKEWLIVGIALVNAYEKDGPIWDYTNFIEDKESGAKTQEFLKQLAKRTLIVTGVDYDASDTFLTLSTCCYDFKDARFVVIARKLRDGEDTSNFDTSKSYYNSNPLMPDKWYEAIAKAQQAEEDAQFGEAEEISEGPVIDDMKIILDDKAKLEYAIGEELDLTGIYIEITDENGETKVYEAKELVEENEYGYDFEISYHEFIAPGEQKVTVRCNDFSASFKVTVKEPEAPKPEIASVDVLTKPSKLTYDKGENLDTAGLSLTVTNTDGETLTVTEGFTCSPTVLNTPGTQTIVVTYEGLSCTFSVTVKDPDAITAISVLTKPSKLEYTVGDKLDTTGLTVDAINSDKQTVKVLSANEVTCSHDPFNAPGKYTVTVTYNGLKSKFEVTVKNKEQTSSVPEPSVPEHSGEETPGTQEGEEEEETSSDSSSEEPVPMLLSSKKNTYPKESSYYNKSLKDTFTINGEKMSVFDAVCQIVAYEAGYGQPDEYVKAQAVASYCYVKNQGGNVSAGVKTKITDQIKSCVAEVIGYAVLDDRSDSYVLSTYFSESCGITADAKWVWGYSNRNLKSVSSSVDDPDPYVYSISSSDFASKVKSKAGITLSGDPEDWLEIKSYWDNTEYINEITLGGKPYTARKLRETVLGGSNLRSVVFEFEYSSKKDKFTFYSYGYGHGVGMSAKGAIAYANKGYDWDEILLKYYSNCYIGMKY